MNTYAWYKLLNVTEFVDSELPSKNLEVILEDVNGLKEIMVTNGRGIGVLIDGVFLSPDLEEDDEDAKFEFEGYAVYVDENSDLWVGILQEDS